MADTNEQVDSHLMGLVNEHAQMIQDLMTQQAETEETSGYQIRDLQKQIVGLRKQRADDVQDYEAQIRGLQNQLDTRDAETEALHSRVQQLTDDVTSIDPDAVTEVVDTGSKLNDDGADKKRLTRVTRLIEKINDFQKAIALNSETTKRHLDDMDIELESYSVRLTMLKEEIRNVNSDTIAKAIAEGYGQNDTATGERLDRIEQRSELMESQYDKLGDLLRDVKKEIKTVKQVPTDVTRRLNELKVDIDDYKATKKAICNAVGGTPKAKQ